MNRTIKRLFATLITLSLSLGMTCTAFAAEPTTNLSELQQATSQNNPIEPRASVLIAANHANFSGTYGEVTVYLDSAEWGANFICFVMNDPNGTYACNVVTPDGKDHFLGMISGNGHGTNKDNFWMAYAPAGYYKFYVNGTGANNATIMGNILG